ncbi:hypothetical protein TNCV_2474011 [Trichonephila clavipes]|nr:hypothetical protein TNCV_2474011 [Trichonephila clavipes]
MTAYVSGRSKENARCLLELDIGGLVPGVMDQARGTQPFILLGHIHMHSMLDCCPSEHSHPLKTSTATSLQLIRLIKSGMNLKQQGMSCPFLPSSVEVEE